MTVSITNLRFNKQSHPDYGTFDHAHFLTGIDPHSPDTLEALSLLRKGNGTYLIQRGYPSSFKEGQRPLVYSAAEAIEQLGLPEGTPVYDQVTIGPLSRYQADCVLRVAANVAMRKHFNAMAALESQSLARTFPAQVGVSTSVDAPPAPPAAA